MITIKNHNIWIDFVFSIKGNLYQCKETLELEHSYLFRFESITGWNYPMFDVSISRDIVNKSPIHPTLYRICSQKLQGPGKMGGFSHSHLTNNEIRDKKCIEKEMLRVLENSCG